MWRLIWCHTVLFSLSSVLTYMHHDILDMYRLIGYPEAQIQQIQKTGFLTGDSMAWFTAFSIVPFLGYLLFVKKYLRMK